MSQKVKKKRNEILTQRHLVICLTSMMFWIGNLAYAGSYTGSAHGNSVNGVNRSTIDGKFSSYSVGNCSHCHEAHASIDGSEPEPSGGVAAGPDPALAFSEEEETCVTCHDGSPVLANIFTPSNKTYRHPMYDYSDKHTLSILEDGLSGAPFRGINRHAECVDCHNPHYIGYPGNVLHSYNAAAPANNNLVSNPLKGVWGVEPLTTPLWSPPTTFTEQNTIPTGSAKEYQICYKCHSYYALQDGDGVTTLIGPSGDYVTDQAMEFSPGNKSAHPVQTTANNRTGASNPKALATVQMKSPWNVAANMGNQTMMCSDCHGNDAASPQGPHGSDKKFMLKDYVGTGTKYYWPTRPDGRLWTLGDVNDNQNNWSTQLFCVNCHPIKSGSSFFNSAHDDSHHYDNVTYQGYSYNGAPCVFCHMAVPHGSKRSRLIAYRSDVAPYDYANTAAVIDGFKKTTRTNYDDTNCYFPDRSGCSDHSDNAGGYDP